MEKIAFYDFDDTLLKHDSMGILLLYYAKRHPLAWLLAFKLAILFIFVQMPCYFFFKIKRNHYLSIVKNE